jgi:cysteine-rich repeat protein
VIGGLEQCDDKNTASGDGCSSTCQIEPFYKCTGLPSVCKPSIQWEAIHAFTVSNVSPEALHYDPQTRSFVGYKQSGGAIEPIELCLNGSLLNPNTNQVCDPSGTCTTAVPPLVPRPEPVSGKLQGATYDPFTNTWLYIQDFAAAKTLTRVSLDYVTQTSDVIAGAVAPTVAAAIACGEDGRLYVAEGKNGSQGVLAFDRNAAKPTGFDLSKLSTTLPNKWNIPTTDVLDALFIVPGFNVVGTFNQPSGVGFEEFRFYNYDSTLYGTSKIPGVLIVDNPGPLPYSYTK